MNGTKILQKKPNNQHISNCMPFFFFMIYSKEMKFEQNISATVQEIINYRYIFV